MVKFLQHKVTDGTNTARVWYSLNNHVSGRNVVTIYAKDYARDLGKIEALSGAYKNDTDYGTDYFDKGLVRLFEDHPLYAAAKARAELNIAKSEARYAARRAA